MTDIFEKVKDQVNIAEAVSLFGIQLNSKDKGLCPFHTEKTPSFSVDRKKNIFTCFGCGETGDVIAFVSKMRECEPLEAAKFLAESFRIDIDDCPKRQSIKDYLKSCIRDVGQTDYFTRRGLTAATIKKYCLGYDVKHRSVVLPYSSELKYYQTRSIADKKFYKPTTEEAGAEPLFNRKALWGASREPVFIVESPLCALSICQCGGSAVSLCGIGGTNKLVKEVKAKKPNAPLVLCLDNDEPGQKATQSLSDELTKLKVPHILYNVAGDKKDPNELLMADAKALAENVKSAKRTVRKHFATAKDSFDALELQSEYIEPPTWVVQDVLPTGLAILCAPSKIGKSWMMLQLGLAVAEGKEFLDFKTEKNGVLYYALEDSKSRIKDRLNKMLKGKKAPSDLRFVIQADTVDSGLLEKIKEELKEFPNIRLVIIDTLQKVRGKVVKNESVYSGDYREMGALKEFADKQKICLLFVHHLRKLADDSDVFNMISGSTALMGAADSIFIISKKKRMDEDAILSMTGRDIQQSDLVIAFNKYDFVWEVRGTAEEIAAKRERQEYENSPIVITIKELIKRNPMGGWKGSANDLMKAVFDITGKQLSESPTGVGKLISKYEYRLHCDGIDHKASKSGSRAHTFSRVVVNTPMGYQRTIYDDD